MQEQRVAGESVELVGAMGAGPSAGGKRALAAFQVIERKGYDKPFWNRIGTAFFNRDGSINVFLDSVPLQGKIQLREDLKDRDRGDAGRRRSEPAHEAE